MSRQTSIQRCVMCGLTFAAHGNSKYCLACRTRTCSVCRRRYVVGGQVLSNLRAGRRPIPKKSVCKECRVGLKDDIMSTRLTTRELAVKYGLSRQRIHQIIKTLMATNGIPVGLWRSTEGVSDQDPNKQLELQFTAPEEARPNDVDGAR